MHRAAQMQRTASSPCNDAGKQLLENLAIIAGKTGSGSGAQFHWQERCAAGRLTNQCLQLIPFEVRDTEQRKSLANTFKTSKQQSCKQPGSE